MCGAIVEAFGLIMAAGDDAVVLDDHDADGDLVFVEGLLRFFKGLLHEMFIVHIADLRYQTSRRWPVLAVFTCLIRSIWTGVSKSFTQSGCMQERSAPESNRVFKRFSPFEPMKRMGICRIDIE